MALFGQKWELKPDSIQRVSSHGHGDLFRGNGQLIADGVVHCIRNGRQRRDDHLTDGLGCGPFGSSSLKPPTDAANVHTGGDEFSIGQPLLS